MEQASNIIFGLDIGTRSVVGVVASIDGDDLKIIDFEQQFHKKRAMRDGQIEDIEGVGALVGQVKATLEERCNMTFQRASIAAAGRALKTVRTTYECDLDDATALTKESLSALEYSAVGLAAEQFATEQGGDDFTCVGYSVVSSAVDGYSLVNLVGHRGKHLKMDIISAFLPQGVVRSLYSVTSTNNLEVDNLTLEPIAAINVIVPSDIRLLNIAIVDIGAGTSDIAISKNGGIVAYDMVTTAGDEITEAIMTAYLTDFETAERIKISLEHGSNIPYTDILGMSHNLPHEDVVRTISPVVEQLSKAICERILDINGHAPVAVFLVGGGSHISGLPELVSLGLGLPEQRVALGGKNGYKNISLPNDRLLSPEFVTPIGIVAMTGLYRGCDFYSVSVNDKRIMLLGTGESRVLDALLLAGIKPSRLIGLSPRPLTYTLNGERIQEKGTPAVSGEIFVNDVSASVDTYVKQGDKIKAVFAKQGEIPEITVLSLLAKFKALYIMFDGKETRINPTCTVNDNSVSADYVVAQSDKVAITVPKTLSEVLEALNFNESGVTSGENKIIFTVNGTEAAPNYPVETGDIIKLKRPAVVNITPASNPSELSEKILTRITLNDRATTVETTSPPMFVDLLNYVDIDTKNPVGTLVQTINGAVAGYTDRVKDGDIVILRFE